MQERDYPVGYGRPPAQTRFKPGTSGNPGGRPKSRRKLAADLSEELDELVTVVEDGRELVVTKQRALVKALVAVGLNGDLRAINALFHSLRQQGDDVGEANSDIAPEDADIVASFAKREGASEAGAAGDLPMGLPAPDRATGD
jgi:antitoxin (DNA-binding transcriptional repressor) of toxin-antitoxin stability system